MTRRCATCRTRPTWVEVEPTRTFAHDGKSYGLTSSRTRKPPGGDPRRHAPTCNRREERVTSARTARSIAASPSATRGEGVSLSLTVVVLIAWR